MPSPSNSCTSGTAPMPAPIAKAGIPAGTTRSSSVSIASDRDRRANSRRPRTQSQNRSLRARQRANIDEGSDAGTGRTRDMADVLSTGPCADRRQRSRRGASARSGTRANTNPSRESGQRTGQRARSRGGRRRPPGIPSVKWDSERGSRSSVEPRREQQRANDNPQPAWIVIVVQIRVNHSVEEFVGIGKVLGIDSFDTGTRIEYTYELRS